MKRVGKIFLAVMGGLVAVLMLLLGGLTLLGHGHLSIRTPVDQRAEFDCGSCATYPEPLVADGHDLVRADGSTVRLRGVMVPAPERLSDQGRLGPDLFRSIAAAGANVVRLPVDPETWRSDPEYIARYLDPAVRWAGEAGLYAIVDLHMIGNIETGAGQAMPQSPARPLAEGFWRTTSAYFRSTPHTLFELFNEPAGIAADAWQPVAADLVRTMRAGGAQQLVIVGGVDFASDASWVADTPIADDNVAYAVHIYPGTGVDWERSFGDVAARHPVLVTEWGFMDENPSPSQGYLNGTQATYGDRLMAFLGERSISWVACWWDAEWEPPMLSGDGTNYTRLGQFVVQQLEGR
jgi:aryl-phospho-beta-D-glucosidase BglC (GH1 family)